jgi:ATP-dependent Clp protease ATP-binding subunit ClpA
MSSNAGSREMAAGKIGFGDSIADSKDGKKALERVFTPEFRNRLDATVFFDALPVDVIRKVARKFLDQLDGQLAEKKVSLEVSPAAVDWFVEHGYDKAMGARPMERLVQNTLKAPLANEILFGKLVNGGVAHVDIKDGQIDITCEGNDASN